MTLPTKKEREQVWILSLFISDKYNPKSLRAFSNLKQICEEHLPGKYELQVIDLSLAPEIAIEQEILAIPTLVRRCPEPVRKIIGDLSDTDRVLVSLGVQALKNLPTRFS